MRQLTESETVELAQEWESHNLYDLVGDEVCQWDEEKLRQEAYRSADIIVSEANYGHPDLFAILHDRALTIWKNDMSRAPMNQLSSDNRKKVVLEWNYWPNDMNKWELWEILQEVEVTEIPHDCYRMAHDEVARGVSNALQDIPKEVCQ